MPTDRDKSILVELHADKIAALRSVFEMDGGPDAVRKEMGRQTAIMNGFPRGSMDPAAMDAGAWAVACRALLEGWAS